MLGPQATPCWNYALRVSHTRMGRSLSLINHLRDSSLTSLSFSSMNPLTRVGVSLSFKRPKSANVKLEALKKDDDLVFAPPLTDRGYILAVT
jgi:hypothetical protein